MGGIHMNKRGKILLIISILAVSLLMAGIAYGLFHVEVVFTEKTYEYGDVNISKDVHDYIDTSEVLSKMAVLDTSGVNTDRVGQYNVVCVVGKRRYNYRINIVDTTAPDIRVKERKIPFSTYNEIDINKIAQADDLSMVKAFSITSCVIDDKEERLEGEMFVPKQSGNYQLTLQAVDVYNNTSVLPIDIEVVESPHFVLLSDRKYKIKAGYSLRDFVYAIDKDGNDITDRIEILDDGGYNPDEEGTYRVEYVVADSSGAFRKQAIAISIGDYEENDYGFDKDYIDTLNEHHFFEYAALKGNDDLDVINNLTAPSSFGINYYTSERKQCAASAFLYRVTDKYLYFVTNKHVAKNMGQYQHLYLTDYNDVQFETIQDGMPYKLSQDSDLAIFAVARSEVDLEQLLTFKTVLLDKNIYDEIDEGTPIFENTQNWGFKNHGDNYDICTEGTIKSMSKTAIPELVDRFPEKVITSSLRTKRGQSGSPVFDYEGHLIGVVSSSTINAERTVFESVFMRIEYITNLADTMDIK